MTNPQFAHVDNQGRLLLPPEIARNLGLRPGSRVKLDAKDHNLKLQRPATSLDRIYLEITNQCNLNCSTCMRNVWDVAFGQITAETFERVLTGLAAYDPKPEVFFGGYGEPLSHPQCLAMIEQIKSLGGRVSLITNGTLLNESISKQLIELQVDNLWVSLDGATPNRYSDVRLDDVLPQVLENLRVFHSLRIRSAGYSLWSGKPKLGIAFVAMKNNLADLPELLKLGTQLGAAQFSISNVLAHTLHLHDQELYQRSLSRANTRHTNVLPHVSLPRLDITPETMQIIGQVLGRNYHITWGGGDLSASMDTCPFIQRGSTAIRWDGELSPCIPLMYTHRSFLGQRERQSQAYAVGNICQRELQDLWLDSEYLTLREKLQAFDFAPCTYCNCCDMPEQNLEDCFGNEFPTCGGCVWTQGLVQCP